MRIFVGVVTAILVMLYPVAIWVGLTHFSARTVGLWILAMIVPTTLWRHRRAAREDLLAALRIPLVIAAVVIPGVILDDRRFVLAMPVLINLALLATFGLSLRGVPMIERFARMQDPALTDEKRAHCRQATVAWVAFFGLNATAAAVLALLAPLAWWAAYNGGIAYGLMGLMFAGEYVVRKRRFGEYGEGLHDRLLSRILRRARDDA